MRIAHIFRLLFVLMQVITPVFLVGFSAPLAVLGSSEKVAKELSFIEAKVHPEMELIVGLSEGKEGDKLVVTDFNLQIKFEWSQPSVTIFKIFGFIENFVIFNYLEENDMSTIFLSGLDIETGEMSWNTNLTQILLNTSYSTITPLDCSVIPIGIFCGIIYSDGSNSLLNVVHLSVSGIVEQIRTTLIPPSFVMQWTIQMELVSESNSFYVYNPEIEHQILRVTLDLEVFPMNTPFPSVENSIYPFSFEKGNYWLDLTEEIPTYALRLAGRDYSFQFEKEIRPIPIYNRYQGSYYGGKYSRVFELKEDLFVVPIFAKAIDTWFGSFFELSSKIEVGLLVEGNDTISVLTKNLPVVLQGSGAIVPLDIQYAGSEIIWVWSVVEVKADGSMNSMVWVSTYSLAETKNSTAIIVGAIIGIPVVSLLLFRRYRRRRASVEVQPYPK